MDSQPTTSFGKALYSEVRTAQKILGSENINGYGEGLVSLAVDITQELSPKIANSLELHVEPCFIEFDFSSSLFLPDGKAGPIPLVK